MPTPPLDPESKSVRRTTVIPEAWAEKIDERAKREGRSTSDQIRHLLGQFPWISGVERPAAPAPKRIVGRRMVEGKLAGPSAEADQIPGTPEWTKRMLTTGQADKVKAFNQSRVADDY